MSRIVLDLCDRVKVIGLSEKGISVRQIAGKMGVGKTGIVKKKEEVIKEYQEGVPSSRKRRCKRAGYKGIN
jgi:IS30 family transposase